MVDNVRRASFGHPVLLCVLLLSIVGTSMTAKQKTTKTFAPSDQVKTYFGPVTFLGQQRNKIEICKPSSFAAFNDIEVGNYERCFCCGKIPKDVPTYPTRFPRQFSGARDVPALAVFTSDTGSLEDGDNDHSKSYLEKVTDEKTLLDIAKAATIFLKPLDPELRSWKPTVVVRLIWNNMVEKQDNPNRNSYQLYIAIRDQETIALYNFTKISWVPPKEELQVGFNIGNDFDFMSLSIPDDPKQLMSFSEVPGGIGQLMVRVSSMPPLRLGCIKDVAGQFQLMVLPAHNATFLGGEVLTVSGPCLDPTASYSCEFDFSGIKMTTPAAANGKNFLHCVVPPFNKTGVATLTVLPPGEAAKFQASISIVRPDEKKARILLSDPSAWTQKDIPEGGLKIEWEQTDFDATDVVLSVLGYSEAEGVAEEDRFKVMKELMVPNSGNFLLKSDNFRCEDVAVCEHHHMGFLSLAGSVRSKVNRTIWSPVLPLAWFANTALTNAMGQAWPDALCEKFEPTPPPYRWQDVACPCSLQEAEINVHQFVETNDCPTIVGGCSKAAPPQRCFKTIPPKGSRDFFLVSTCCFSTEDNFLLYSEDVGFDAKSNHGSRGAVRKPGSDLPELSFYFRESLNFFYCCVWRHSARFCPYFNLRRPTPDCRSFANGGFGATIGDPHVISFGNQRYTLNPKGEYVLLRSDQLEVQVRFAKAVPESPVTFLTAVAFRAGESKISVLMQSFRGFHATFRNGSAIDLRSGEYSEQGVRISATETPSGSVLRVLIASGNQSVGLLLQREKDADYINMETSISKALQGKTVGLLGRWQPFSNISSMVKADGTLYQPWDSSHNTTLKTLARDYKVNSEEESLFWYRLPWTFKNVNPEAQNPSAFSTGPVAPIPSFCENDKFCAFDNIATNSDKKIAKATLAAVQNFDGKMQKVKETVASCGRPDLPAATFNSRNFQSDSQIEVTGCVDDYEAKKKLVMTCKRGPDGTLRWEPDPSETSCEYVGDGGTQPARAGLIAGLVILFLLLILLLVLAAFCFIRRRRREKKRERQEKKQPVPTHDQSPIPSKGQGPGPVLDEAKLYHYHAEETGDVYAFPVPNERRSLERSGQRVSQSSHHSSDAVDAPDISPTQRRLMASQPDPIQEQVRQQLRKTLQVRAEDDSEEDDSQPQQQALTQEPQYDPQHLQVPGQQQQHPQYNQQQQPHQEQQQHPQQIRQQQPQNNDPQNPRQQPPYNPQNPRQQQPHNPQNPRQQPPYNPQNPRQQQPYNPQNPRQQQPYNPQNPRQQPPYNPQNPRQQPPYNPKNPRQQQPYNPQNPRQQPPYNPQNPRQQQPYNPQQQQAPRANMYQKRTSSGDYHFSPGRQSGGFVSSEASV